ncbi:MAG: glycosyltransferase [Patescibacteria group bacterium]|nr:glycosyltransferase [Patescibacteria group bacterium]MCL5431533.1 glycosyltransferase [Patescibacteria group bacterium]
MSKIVICMPTYNEKDNVGRMIDILFKDVFPKIKNHQMALLIFDDTSPDETWKVVQEKMKKYKNLYLSLAKGKQGLGYGYKRAFRYAIDKLKADAVMEMDVDFQHDPNDVPRFVQAFDEGIDYVIGSRYVPGGSIPREWGIERKFLSVVGNLFYQVTLFMWNVHDFTTGFRLARVSILKKVSFDRVFIRSFAYKTLLLYEMMKQGAKVREIPLNFQLRKLGDSKMTTNTIIEQLKVIGIIWADRLGLNR